MSEYVTEKKFVVAEGDGGELYIFLTAKKDNPAAPQIIYDGKDHAVFLRNREQKIILDYIHPDIRDKLKKAKEVVMVETLLGDNIKDSYFADMKIVDHIPVDWSLIGLSTWEKALAGKPVIAGRRQNSERSGGLFCFFIKIKTGCRCSRSFVLVILVSNCRYIFCRFQFLFSGKALFRFWASQNGADGAYFAVQIAETNRYVCVFFI